MDLVDSLENKFRDRLSISRGNTLIHVDEDVICLESDVDIDDDGTVNTARLCFDVKAKDNEMILDDMVVERGSIFSEEAVDDLTDHLVNEARIRRMKKVIINVDDPDIYRLLKFVGWRDDKFNFMSNYKNILKGKESDMNLSIKV